MTIIMLMLIEVVIGDSVDNENNNNDKRYK